MKIFNLDHVIKKYKEVLNNNVDFKKNIAQHLKSNQANLFNKFEFLFQ